MDLVLLVLGLALIALDKGLVSCRSVADFRSWVKVRESIQQQKK